MPKFVDHDTRRNEIVGAAWRVIQREGLEGTTIRAIAAEAGASTAIVTHYFRDKKDILKSALRMSQSRIARRRKEALKGLAGLEALEASLAESLPLDDDRRLELHIEVSFWARAISDEESATEHLRSHDTWRAAIASSVQECVELGEIGPCDVLEVADTLVALVDGLGVDALMHPERLPPERQRLVVRRELERLRTSTDHEDPVRESRRRRVAGARTRVDDAG